MAWPVSSRGRADPTAEQTTDEEKEHPMAATLRQILLAPEVEPRVVADCERLIEQEVSGKSGVSGTAVKLAYKTVKSLAPGYLQGRVQSFLPELVAGLEPYWADFTASGASGFGDYLVKRGDEVSEALLTVTDARAKTTQRPAAGKAYGAIRGSAARHVAAALPDVGSLVQKYADESPS
jgi:hypothetical protein